jgi:hypothetical protein
MRFGQLTFILPDIFYGFDLFIQALSLSGLL